MVHGYLRLVATDGYFRLMVKGSGLRVNSGSWLLPTNMAYEKKEYKKRIRGVTICDTMLNISSKGILDNSWIRILY